MTLTSAKPRRFYFHYFKQRDQWSIHFMGACHVVDDFRVKGLDLEGKRNNRQPRRVVQGFATKLTIENGVATLS